MPKSSPDVCWQQRSWSEKIILFFAFGFGFGFLKPAPGTWGTLPGVAIAWLVMDHVYLHAVVLIVISMLGVWLCQRSSTILSVHDHGGIVIDEIAGVLLTLLFFPPTLLVLSLGFVWFRIFDILKPPPIRWADQHVAGGLGIMLDDWIAGGFAWVALWLTLTVVG